MIRFNGEQDKLEKLKELNLLSKVAKKTKKFKYKGNGIEIECDVVGYHLHVHGEHTTLVIEFSGGEQLNIHPAYLKQMQAKSFGEKEEEGE